MVVGRDERADGELDWLDVIILNKRESADGASQRRHYADAQYFREAVEK